MNTLSQERWNRLWNGFGTNADSSAWFERLQTLYSEPHRHYHNDRHIAACLKEFDEVKHLIGKPEIVELALWFHDAIVADLACRGVRHG